MLLAHLKLLTLSFSKRFLSGISSTTLSWRSNSFSCVSNVASKHFLQHPLQFTLSYSLDNNLNGNLLSLIQILTLYIYIYHFNLRKFILFSSFETQVCMNMQAHQKLLKLYQKYACMHVTADMKYAMML